MDRILSHNMDQENLRVFEILVEIYKFFKDHPPENLMVIIYIHILYNILINNNFFNQIKDNVLAFKDLDFIFRELKKFIDGVI